MRDTVPYSEGEQRDTITAVLLCELPPLQREEEEGPGK